MNRGLTPKQTRFVDEYLVDLNATQAAIRAGYSAKTADAIGRENLGKPLVAAAVAARKKERAERTRITADRVLLELARIAFFDVRRLFREDGSMKAPHELDDDAAAALASLEVVEEFDDRPAETEQEPQAHGGSLKRSRRTLVGYTRKVKVFDKSPALTNAMRHLGMFEQDNNQVAGGFVALLAKLNGRG
jgi:phage terminase small subunit